LSQADIHGSTCGEYDDGDTLWAIVWSEDGTISANGSIDLDIEE
jgi:hypothetical protein